MDARRTAAGPADIAHPAARTALRVEAAVAIAVAVEAATVVVEAGTEVVEAEVTLAAEATEVAATAASHNSN